MVIGRDYQQSKNLVRKLKLVSKNLKNGYPSKLFGKFTYLHQ